jgi:hypothetical protein
MFHSPLAPSPELQSHAGQLELVAGAGRSGSGSDMRNAKCCVEHAAVEKRLASGIEGPVGDEGGRERRRDLRQRERPHRPA